MVIMSENSTVEPLEDVELEDTQEGVRQPTSQVRLLKFQPVLLRLLHFGRNYVSLFHQVVFVSFAARTRGMWKVGWRS